MAGEPMNSEIHRIISEQGWNDSSVLEILWSYVAAQQSEDALTEHFRQMQEQESPSPPEGDDVEMVTRRFIVAPVSVEDANHMAVVLIEELTSHNDDQLAQPCEHRTLSHSDQRTTTAATSRRHSILSGESMDLFVIDKSFAPPPTGEKRERVLGLISELRTGGHRQVFSCLKENDVDGQQCLCLEGIACDLFRRRTSQGRWREEKEWWYFSLEEGKEDENCAPPEVWDWFGMPHEPAENDGVDPVAWHSLNDGDDNHEIERHTFEELATVLEVWLS